MHLCEVSVFKFRVIRRLKLEIMFRVEKLHQEIRQHGRVFLRHLDLGLAFLDAFKDLFVVLQQMQAFEESL